MIHRVQIVSYKTNQALVSFSSILEIATEFVMQIQITPSSAEFAVQVTVQSSSPVVQPEHQPSHPCPHPPAHSLCWQRWWRSRSCPSWRTACVHRAPRTAAKHSLVSDKAQRNMSRLKKTIPEVSSKSGGTGVAHTHFYGEFLAIISSFQNVEFKGSWKF